MLSAEFDSLPSSSPSPVSTPEVKKEEEPHTPRSTNLKFPPRDTGLKIPRSLFLASATSKFAGLNDEGGENELGDQAAEMVRLMRRSVVLHEFKERVLWDEDLDPHAASEERVQFVRLEGERDGKEEEGEEGVLVGEWLDGVDR